MPFAGPQEPSWLSLPVSGLCIVLGPSFLPPHSRWAGLGAVGRGRYTVFSCDSFLSGSWALSSFETEYMEALGPPALRRVPAPFRCRWNSS